MTVSVIIPCHNCERWIGRALESVATQTQQPHEVIVIDDASADESIRRAKQTAIEFHLLRVGFRNAAAARNAGIERATGEYIAFLDADDQWYPHHLASATEFLDRSGDAAYMAAADYIYDDGQPVLEVARWPIADPVSNMDALRFLELLLHKFCFCNITVVARRSRVVEIGGFDAQHPRRHDVELFLRMIHQHGWTFNPTSTAQVTIRRNGSISSEVMECTRALFQVLHKNSRLFPEPQMQRLLRSRAKAALAAAIRKRSFQVAADIYRETREVLGWPDRLGYLARSMIAQTRIGIK